MRIRLVIVMFVAAALVGCGGQEADVQESGETNAAAATGNPLLRAWDLPYGMPPFDRIEDGHFEPAMERAMTEEREEVAEIASNAEAPTFENTIVALEESGALLRRVTRVFRNLASADTNETRRALQRELSPKLSEHRDAILLDAELFSRVEALYESREELDLNTEGRRLLEKYYRDFVRAGAKLGNEEKERLREINSRLASLSTEFSQNVLEETNQSALVVDSREELSGLSESEIQAAAEEAKRRELEGKYVVTLQNTSGQPALASLNDRDVRRRLHEASLSRGSRGNEFDNRAIVAETVRLRAERAQLLGYETHADYVLEEQTAGSIEAVQDMLGKLAPAAVEKARREAADLQAMIDETEDPSFELAPWDWAYYTDKLRARRYDFDESRIRPYFEIDRVLEEGVFHAAGRLFGLSFEEREDLPTYHPDVRVFEVFDHDGSSLALFMVDPYARASKRGGAWMNAYRSQSGLLGTVPVVGNHLNVPKAPGDEPTLMTFDEVTTMFHEFGHALHGMLSDVEYPRFAGTSVPRDFVEFPSQVNEMWATWPAVLENYASHHESGERIPQSLLDRVLDAQKFNEGFRSTEYLAASILDMCYHTLTPAQVPSADEILDFEAQCLEDAGIAFEPIPPRYRTTYFSHIMGGYAAGYYSYIWSEVLDAETVRWLKENGGLKRENGDLLRQTVLSQGNSRDPMSMFRELVGREPSIQPLLERRGLVTKEARAGGRR
jgi:peptidyl-dipeptidase Dcp